MKNRKALRKDLLPYRLHTKKFVSGKEKLKETSLTDGSIKFQVEGFASTEVKDGSGDVVKAEGINIDRYMNNPIIKRQHKRGEENNIGVVTSIEKQSGEGLYIKADIILNPEIEQHKAVIHGLRHGLINGFSIGFGDIKQEYDDTIKANVISGLELYEISLVDIPDNPMTVRKFIDKVLSKDTTEEEDEEETKEIVDGEIVEDKEEVAEEKVEEVEEKPAEATDAPVEETETEAKEEEATPIVGEEEKPVEAVEEEVAEEGKSAVTDEVKELSAKDTIESKLTELLNKEYGIDPTMSKKYIWICGLFVTSFVYNLYECGEEGINKYYRRQYMMGNGEIALVGESVEVEAVTEWIDKTKQLQKDIEETQDSQEAEATETVASGEEAKVEETPETVVGNDEAKVEDPTDEGKTKTLTVDVKESDEYLQLKTDHDAIEKMLSDMLTTNEKLLEKAKQDGEEIARLTKLVDKAKKLKLSSGMFFNKSSDGAGGRIDNIVSSIRGN